MVVCWGGVGVGGGAGGGGVMACTGSGFPRPVCPSLTSTTGSKPRLSGLTAPRTADDPQIPWLTHRVTDGPAQSARPGGGVPVDGRFRGVQNASLPQEHSRGAKLLVRPMFCQKHKFCIPVQVCFYFIWVELFMD